MKWQKKKKKTLPEKWHKNANCKLTLKEQECQLQTKTEG